MGSMSHPFLLANGVNYLMKILGIGWRNNLCDLSSWQRLEKIPDKEFWDVKQKVKSRMLTVVRDAFNRTTFAPSNQ
jgi:starch phosphorylase